MRRPGFPGVLRHAALGDLVILAPFALPVVAEHYLRLWFLVNGWLGGAALPPALDPTTLLFINLFGLFAVIFSVLRLRLPSVVMARMAGVTKLLAVALIGFGLITGAAPVFAIALVADLVLGLLLVMAIDPPSGAGASARQSRVPPTV